MICLMTLKLFNALEFLEDQSPAEPNDSQSRILNSAFNCNSGSCQSRHWSLCDCIRPRREASESKSSKRRDTDFGDIAALSDLGVDCNDNLLIDFTLRYEDVDDRYSRDESPSDEIKNKNKPTEWFGTYKVWYEYTCSSEKSERRSVSKHETEWVRSRGLTDITDLQNHKVVCPDKKALVKFKLDYDRRKGTRYEYECADHYNFNSNNSGKYFEFSDKFWAEGEGTYALRNIRVASFGDNYLSGFEMVSDEVKIETSRCCQKGLITCIRFCPGLYLDTFKVWKYKAYYCN